MSVIYLYVLCLLLTKMYCFYMPKLKHYPIFEDSGDPVFVTPLLAVQGYEKAQEACAVSIIEGHESYAGYLTVRSTDLYSTEFFFWFFPSEFTDPNYSPLVLNLQGGTGVSCLLSVFEGQGPFYIDMVNETINFRDCRLTKYLSVLYIDHPAGSGYSYTGDDVGYSYNKNETAELLFEALKVFFMLFPDLRYNRLYIHSESYSSSYVPALARTIFRYNNRPNPLSEKINLVGLIMGSTFFDPIHMISNYSDRLHKLGLINSQQLSEFENLRNKMDFYIYRNKSDLAFKYFDKMVLGGLTRYPTLFQNATNYTSHFNYKVSENYDEKYQDSVAELIQSSGFRSLLHIGNDDLRTNYRKVLKFMAKDILVKLDPNLFNMLLKYGYRVLTYNGQKDLLIPRQSTENYMRTVKWTNRKKFDSFLTHCFKVNHKITAYYKRYGSLWQVLVLDAGHMVSKDQPKVLSELIVRFINKTIF